MMPSQIITFTHLVELFEEGLIGEVEFVKTALNAGATAAVISEVLESIRREDNVSCP